MQNNLNQGILLYEGTKFKFFGKNKNVIFAPFSRLSQTRDSITGTFAHFKGMSSYFLLCQSKRENLVLLQSEEQAGPSLGWAN